MSTLSSSRAHSLLALGAALGFMLAVSGLLESTALDRSSNAVAVVNGEPISKQDYLNYLSLLAKDKRNPLNAGDRRHILNRMIEERLLIERGVAIGLPQSDPAVRKAISNALIQTVIADEASKQASERELRNFYRKNLQYFSQPARIQVQRLSFRGDVALSRAQRARADISAGKPYATVAQQLASPEVLSVPNSPLPLNKLRQYIGPTLTDLALLMPTGSISEPIAEDQGYSLLLVINNQASSALPYEDVQQLVANEYRRRAGDEQLREYLDALRQRADVQIDEAFLDSLAELP